MCLWLLLLLLLLVVVVFVPAHALAVADLFAISIFSCLCKCFYSFVLKRKHFQSCLLIFDRFKSFLTKVKKLMLILTFELAMMLSGLGKLKEDDALIFFGPVGRSADPVFENFGLSFCLFFYFFGVWGAWMLIRNCPIRRCGHFDRTILSGVEIFGYF